MSTIMQVNMVIGFLVGFGVGLAGVEPFSRKGVILILSLYFAITLAVRFAFFS